MGGVIVTLTMPYRTFAAAPAGAMHEALAEEPELYARRAVS
jgi:hypothetical protein